MPALGLCILAMIQYTTDCGHLRQVDSPFTKINILVILIAGCLLTNTIFSVQNDDKQQESATVEWKKFTDSETGNEVWQLTNHDAPSEAFYFYAQSFTSDDRYVIFRSQRSGVWDAYRCDLSNGEIVPLTSGENLDRACIHQDGKSMAFISGWKYYVMDVHTLKQKELFDFTGKLPVAPQFRPTFSSDGRYTLVYTRDEALGSALYRVDLAAKEIMPILEVKTGGFGHEQINPVNPDLVTYVPSPDTQNDMSLPMEKRSRTRLINIKTGTDMPYLIAPDNRFADGRLNACRQCSLGAFQTSASWQGRKALLFEQPVNCGQ